ncbi:acyl-CoA thioesterase [Candidatus Palauibacter sp.]|uniref:acyl-CoA thioesterase n=1 Tax=Candidatus Palauibacter sp. TaxID=3101350 RepID=UPI003B5AE884
MYRRRVEFADTDTANLIHFTALMRFMEEAEHAFYRSLDFHGYRWSEASVFGMPRVSVSCDYLGAVRYGDVVEVRLQVREVRTKAIRYAAEFTIDGSEGREIVARSDWTVVCARRDHGSRDWRGVEIPARLRRQLEVASRATRWRGLRRRERSRRGGRGRR